MRTKLFRNAIIVAILLAVASTALAVITKRFREHWIIDSISIATTNGVTSEATSLNIFGRLLSGNHGGITAIAGGAGSGSTKNGGNVSLLGGASGGASGTAGAVNIDTGAKTGGTGAAVTIATTNATGATIGASAIPVTLAGDVSASKELSVGVPTKLHYRLGSQSINVNTTTSTTLVTIPADKSLIVNDILARTASASFNQGQDPIFSVGCNPTAYDNISISATYTHPAATDTAFHLTLVADAPVCPPGSTLRVNVTTPSTSSTTATFDVFGYLY